MEGDDQCPFDDEQRSLEEIGKILSTPHESHELTDAALRAYFQTVSGFRRDFIYSDHDTSSYSRCLLRSALFEAQQDYCRQQIIYSLLQEEAPKLLYVIASVLLIDGRENEATLEMMNRERVFPRLLELIHDTRWTNGILRRRLLELLYEMSRIQRLRLDEISLIDDAFITSLFETIEEVSDDVDDPYHYPVIQAILVVNEQYMVSAYEPTSDTQLNEVPTNRVLKILSLRGPAFKTFGENIILLLNRENEISLQLLILKLLYLLFTTQPTCEYFYTNDLRVLVDVMIRNLLDLPNDVENQSLRHTYLRVLYPLLSDTQLRHAPHYKRDELLRLLAILSGGRSAHFGPVDQTTVRLVERCLRVPWLVVNRGHTAASDASKHTLGITLRGSDVESTWSVIEVSGLDDRSGLRKETRKIGHNKGPPVAPRRKGASRMTTTAIALDDRDRTLTHPAK
ncbi:MAG: hypothetical protein M1825_000032 [Sarcosagium campestre]|nr:MAG: hypothetical protein M1825_000032 [Sarcosagium campestre]